MRNVKLPGAVPKTILTLREIFSRLSYYLPLQCTYRCKFSTGAHKVVELYVDHVVAIGDGHSLVLQGHVRRTNQTRLAQLAILPMSKCLVKTNLNLALGTWGLLHARKMSSQISLCSPHRFISRFFFPLLSTWLWIWEFYRHFQEIGKINSVAFFFRAKSPLI